MTKHLYAIFKNPTKKGIVCSFLWYTIYNNRLASREGCAVHAFWGVSHEGGDADGHGGGVKSHDCFWDVNRNDHVKSRQKIIPHVH